MVISPESKMIWHLRGVANFSRIAEISSLITVRSRTGSLRIDSRYVIVSRVSASSVSRSMRDSRVSWRSCMSRMSNGLDLGELERLGHQSGLRRGHVVACPDEGDDRVDDVERLDPTLEDVGPLLCLVEAELRSAGDHVDLVVDVAVQRLHEVERARHPVDERDHVDRERRLQLGELVEVVQHDVRVAVTLERDDQLGLAARRPVVDVGDPVEVTTVDEFLVPVAIAEQLV